MQRRVYSTGHCGPASHHFNLTVEGIMLYRECGAVFTYPRQSYRGEYRVLPSAAKKKQATALFLVPPASEQ